MNASPYSPPAATYTVGTAVGSSDPIPMGSFCGGVFTLPSSQTNTTLTFFHSNEEDGTFVPLRDPSSNAAVTMTVTASTALAYPQPDLLNECKFVKITAAAEFEIEHAGKTM